MPTWPRPLLGMVAAGLLVGCVTAADRISYVQYDSYSSADLAKALADGAIPLRVYGVPSEKADQERTAIQIASAMTAANFGQPARVEPAATAAANAYALVVRFGGGGAPRAVCQPGADLGSGAGRNYVAAFCHKERALSYLAGAVGDADIDGRGFRQAMAGAASELLPIENPEYIDCDFRAC